MRPVLLAATCAGILLIFSLSNWHVAYGLCGGTLLLALCCTWHPTSRRHAATLLFFALGSGYAILRLQTALAQQWPVEPASQTRPVTLQVASIAQTSENNTRFTAWVETTTGRHKLLIHDRHQRDWPIGSRWQMPLRIRAAIGESNGSGFNREAWALANGIHGQASASIERQALPPATGPHIRWQQWRERVQQQLLRPAHAYPQGSALMNALSTGHYGQLTQQDWHTFRQLGINHLISISGLHIGMVALTAAWLARLLLRPIALAEPRRLHLAIGLIAALFYAALADFSIPVQRSLIMLAVFSWYWWHRRAAGAWRGWLTALFLVLIWHPFAALSLGFWFSFSMVAALIWVNQGRLKHHKQRIFWRSQLAATVLTLWASAQTFGTIPILSPLANLILIPWFSLILVPLTLLCTLLPIDFLLYYTATACEHTLQLLHHAASHGPLFTLPKLPTALWLAVLLASALLPLPRANGPHRWASAIFLLALFHRSPAPEHGNAHIRIHDVGQGLSIQIRTRHHWLLYDTGTAHATQSQLLPALWAQNLPPPDLLILSHRDNDHDGGHLPLQVAFPPRQLQAGQPQHYPNAQPCHGGQHWQWDGVHFELLTPKPHTHPNDNEHSCVLRVIAHGQALLITGDLGQQSEHQLIQQHGHALQSQFLLLGHHGSRSSTSTAWLDTVRPHTAIATTGFANSYGHPATVIRHRLSARQITLYTSAEHGCIDITLDGRNQPIQLQTPHLWQRKPFNIPTPHKP